MAVITALVAFLTTNMDDIFLLMLLFAQADSRSLRRNVWLGQFLGIGVLTAVSLAAAFGLGHLPERYLRLLGLVPLLLALRLLVKGGEGYKEQASVITPLSVAMLTISAGGDNIGVYIPLFTHATPAELALIGAVFLALTALWCLLGQNMVRAPKVGETLRRHSRWLVPLVFLLLGAGILLGVF